MPNTLPVELLHRCLAQVTHGITLADVRRPDAPLVYVNEAFTALTGYTQADMQGLNCRILQQSDHRQPGITILREAQKAHQPARAVLRNYRKDGSRFWCEVSITPVFNPSGELTHYIGVQKDVTAQRQAEARVLRYQRQLQALARLLMSTEQVERRKLAGEVHDRMGQTLSLCRMQLGQLAKELGGMATYPALAQSCQLVESAIEEARALMKELNPPLLAELGLAAALQSQGEFLAVRYGVPVVVQADLGGTVLPEELTQLVFRSAHELVVNAGKHAVAHSIHLRLNHQPHHVVLEVADDGRGFTPGVKSAASLGGFGLASIRERAMFRGGDLLVQSTPGQGTRVVLRLPLAADRKTLRPA